MSSLNASAKDDLKSQFKDYILNTGNLQSDDIERIDLVGKKASSNSKGSSSSTGTAGNGTRYRRAACGIDVVVVLRESVNVSTVGALAEQVGTSLVLVWCGFGASSMLV